ncbi:CPBP family glutamic-type intramembrane protease [Derxia lacustris]|uniref:CPBP family glutamic-type intramembrane protease n=1 Tax=Derxia lacustris TaxID=764842 RepID=UPI000A16F626|nr:CPBP family glutamic-type intramembrane protease [Derxia lacustris]
MLPQFFPALRRVLPGRGTPPTLDGWLIAATLAMPALAGLTALFGNPPCDDGHRPPPELLRWLVIGPVVEECALRAGLQNQLREFWPAAARRWRLDVWLTSAGYAALLATQTRHPPAGLAALAVASLLIGMVHARARDRADAQGGAALAGLGAAIGLHMGFNALMLLGCGMPPPPLLPGGPH